MLTVYLGIEIGFAQRAYLVVESEGEITVEVVLHQPSAPSFPITVTVEVDSHDAGYINQTLLYPY